MQLWEAECRFCHVSLDCLHAAFFQHIVEVIAFGGGTDDGHLLAPGLKGLLGMTDDRVRAGVDAVIV